MTANAWWWTKLTVMALADAALMVGLYLRVKRDEKNAALNDQM